MGRPFRHGEDMDKRTYRAPEGATSITVNGKTYDVDGKGRLHCDDEAAHAELLSHGYTYGDAPAAAVTTYSAAELAGMKDALEKHAFELKSDLDERAAALSARAAELDARAAELANKETDIAMRVYALDQREAALAAAAVPPPPPADTKASKAKG